MPLIHLTILFVCLFLGFSNAGELNPGPWTCWADTELRPQPLTSLLFIYDFRTPFIQLLPLEDCSPILASPSHSPHHQLVTRLRVLSLYSGSRWHLVALFLSTFNLFVYPTYSQIFLTQFGALPNASSVLVRDVLKTQTRSYLPSA
jgi:hypothetical protein